MALRIWHSALSKTGFGRNFYRGNAMQKTVNKLGIIESALSAVRESNLTLWGTVLVIASAGVVGIVLIATAPFDGPSRSNVGVGLLTGVIVGIALIGFESMLDRRRDRREQEALQNRREAFRESSKLALSSLIVDCVELIVMVLLENNEARPDSKSAPPHWKGDSDRRLVTRGLMWCAEFPNLDSSWWQEHLKLVACDAIVTLSIDLAERSMIKLTEENWGRFNIVTNKALERLAVAAERLSESGDPYSAHDIDKVADLLTDIPSTWTKANVPDLGIWGTEKTDHVLTVGGPFERIRAVVCFTVDLLGADLDFRAVLAPSQVSDVPISRQRWGGLTHESAGNDLWSNRFAEDSWMRRLLNVASDDVRQIFGANRG